MAANGTQHAPSSLSGPPHSAATHPDPHYIGSNLKMEDLQLLPTLHKCFDLLPTKLEIEAMFTRFEATHRSDIQEIRDGLQSFHANLDAMETALPPISNAVGQLQSLKWM